MKIARKALLEIINSNLNEQSTTNPGSRVRASASRGQTNEMDRNRKQAERELQMTVDWFEDTVFPALERNQEVVAGESYVFAYADKGTMTPEAALIVIEGTKFSGPDDTATIMSLGVSGGFRPTDTDYTLSEIYQDLERQVLDFDLDVAMTSDAGEVERRIEDAPAEDLQADRMAQVDADDSAQADIDRMTKDAGLDEATLNLTRRELHEIIRMTLNEESVNEVAGAALPWLARALPAAGAAIRGAGTAAATVGRAGARGYRSGAMTRTAAGFAGLPPGLKAGALSSHAAFRTLPTTQKKQLGVVLLTGGSLFASLSPEEQESHLSFVQSNDAGLAYLAYVALEGLGTDDEAIDQLFANRAEIPKIYGDYAKVLAFMGEDTKEDLIDWLRDDGRDSIANIVQDVMELFAQSHT